MARPALLNEVELAQHLKDILLWRHEGATIVREIATSNFAAAIGLVNAIALLAEKADHHPDWSNAYNKVSIRLTSHDSGGITDLDFQLAEKIDKLAQK